jgi:hypothetical protein
MAQITFVLPPTDRNPPSTIGTGQDPANPHTWRDLLTKLNTMNGQLFGRTYSAKAFFSSSLPADLTTIVNAVTPTNVALTIAAQPPHARKLQINMHIGTTTTTAVTAGTCTLVGLDQDGNAITEVISLPCTSTTAFKSKWAYASLTSATVAAYAANGSGTGNTIGIGPTNDFGVPTGSQVSSLSCVKATKITKVLGTSNIAADDVASTTTVDAVARTIAPTTAPAASGLVDFEFSYAYQLAG